MSVEVLSRDQLAELSDHDLLLSAAADQRRLNLLEASRQAKIVELYDRRARDFQARRASGPHVTMTPGQETAVELSPLLGMTESKVRADLRVTRRLQRQFPAVWRWVESGRLDLYRASMLTTAADKHLTDPAAVAELAERMGAWLDEQWARQQGSSDAGDPAGESRVLAVTTRQIRNRVSYLVKKLRPRAAQERHEKRYDERSVTVDSTGDGMGSLYLTSDVASLRAVAHRLTLIAKAMRKAGEPRTLAQLRCDLAVELLLGKLTVGARTTELERPETSPSGDPLDTVEHHEIGAWARPVINVTVPIQTLMELTDEPGVLSGGESLPAGLVRALAAQPGSTWYRMLTDPARQCVELSTTSYKPTGPIIRQTVADWQTCFATTCVRPATECELDHRVPAPEGATSTENLGPGCKGHHKCKHAPGFGLLKDLAGRLWFTTAAGFRHPVSPAEQPVGEDWGDPAIWDEQVSVAELRDALSWLAQQRTSMESTGRWLEEVDQLWADYRASYPDADDEEIHGWIHDDDPSAPEPPPILRRGATLQQVLDAEKPAPVDRTGMDDETLAELDELEQELGQTA